MNTKILKAEIQHVIFEKSDNTIDIAKFILSGSPFEDVTVQELAQQISGRRKAKDKLPVWYATLGIYYPATLNLEQTSSEITAIYKSDLVLGNTLMDLTGGFGIDDYYFSKKMKHVIHCELDPELSEIAAHNFKVLNSENITTIAGDGLDTLRNQDSVDWLYIDPSRRHDSKGKVFFLEDCLPDVPTYLDFFFEKSNCLLIKTSPLLDIQVGLKSLQYVKEIHVVAVDNEVKELLWVLEKEYNGNVGINTCNITKGNEQKFSFLYHDEAQLISNFSTPKKYLYEPNAAILKSGAFSSVSNTFGLDKLHINSHLYTSDQKTAFPGRRFEIIATHPYQKQLIKKLGIKKANITTRNFSESVTTLRKKFGIKDGGDTYLFFTTTYDAKKIVIQCQKI